ncbi:transcription initiation at TATA-containing promoter protein [Conglomerata obtusa]
MDISTVRWKIKSNMYTSVSELKKDMELMFNNCYIYNPKDTPVHKMGVELEKQFNNLYNKMPTSDTLKKKRKTDVKINEVIEVKKPKVVAKNLMSAEDRQMCEKIIEELLRPKNHGIMWPFMDPINDDLVPGYSLVIKSPTDMGLIKRKFESNEFESLDDLQKELKLMVNNCFKFNQDVKKIYDCAIEADRLCENLFAREKSEKHEIIRKISDLRNNIKVMEREILVLEEALNDDEKCKKTIKEYSLDERLEIGKQLTELNQIQTTRIAQIISKGGVHVDFVNKSEVEVDMRLLPDTILYEIEEYIKNTSNYKNKENLFNDSDDEITLEI